MNFARIQLEDFVNSVPRAGKARVVIFHCKDKKEAIEAALILQDQRYVYTINCEDLSDNELKDKVELSKLANDDHSVYYIVYNGVVPMELLDLTVSILSSMHFADEYPNYFITAYGDMIHGIPFVSNKVTVEDAFCFVSGRTKFYLGSVHEFEDIYKGIEAGTIDLGEEGALELKLFCNVAGYAPYDFRNLNDYIYTKDKDPRGLIPSNQLLKIFDTTYLKYQDTTSKSHDHDSITIDELVELTEEDPGYWQNA